jgi:hypothetical protein
MVPDARRMGLAEFRTMVGELAEFTRHNKVSRATQCDTDSIAKE